MKLVDVKNIKIAVKYANALIDTAKENNAVDKVFNDLIFITETINCNKDLSKVLANPIIKNQDKIEITEKIFGIHIDKITLDFIKMLIENNRLNIINEILNQYSKIYNSINNIVKPLIISAIELGENQKNKIIEKLEQKLSKKVLPEYSIKSEIIGGLIIELDDLTIDCSIKTKFENMKKQLTKGNRYGNN